MQVLVYMARRRGETITRDDLIAACWSGVVVGEDAIQRCIGRLRKAAGSLGGFEIQTLNRLGYRLRELAATGEASHVSQAEGAPALAVLNTAAAATIPQVRDVLNKLQEPGIGTFDGKPSIAVLPFTNFSDDPEQGYFADGIVEDLTTALSRFRTFAVVARNSAFVYKDRAYDIRDAAQALGVRYALEGSVRRVDRTVRVTAQLIDAHSGAHLWAEKFDGRLDDVFDFEDAITENVVGAIEPHIRMAEVRRSRRKRPESLDAYDLYLQALPLISSVDAHNYSGAIVLLERAIALDPGFASALAHACWAYGKRLGSGKTPPGVDDAQRCIELAHRALAADSNDATVLAIAGLQLMGLEDDAERGYGIVMRAFALNPNSFLVSNFAGFAHRQHGNFGEAVACHMRALGFMPGAPEVIWCYTAIAVAHLSAGRFEEALEWALRARDVHDGLEWTQTTLAAAFAHVGCIDEARAALQTVTAARPELTIAEFFGRNQRPGPHDGFLVEGLAKAGIPWT